MRSSGDIHGLSAEPDRREVLRLLGLHRGPRVPAAVAARLEGLWKPAVSLLRPRVWEAPMPITEVGPRSITVEGGVVFENRRLARALRDASFAVFFVATVGEGPERRIERWTAEGRVADAFLLDAFASAAVECLVDRYHRSAAARALRQGLATTLRFSPGYCDWPLEDQRKLFGLFRGEGLEVSLTASCFMRPRKSVSGVFGLLPAPGAGRESPPVYNPCRECGRRDCMARRPG